MSKSRQLEKEKIEAFKRYWEEEGRPEPYSAKYIDLTRAFFYTEGFRDALDLCGHNDERWCNTISYYLVNSNILMVI